MIIEINCGHCLTGKDTGAQGCRYKEEVLTRQVGNLVMAKLKAKGHTVINCTVDSANSVPEALNSICSKANAVKSDLFLSIHFNASDGQGHGTEIFTYGAKETKEGANILKNITALGYANRGVKDGSKLAVIRNTKAPAMLVECCFIDNAADMKIFDADKMAGAIASGLIWETSPITKPVATIPKVNYNLEFQKWYNQTTKTSAPILEDGKYSSGTQKAYETIGKLMRGEY